MICEVEGCTNPVRARTFCWMHYQRLRKSGDIPISRFARPLISRLHIAEEDWLDEALCPQTDAELFFPEKGGSTREAKLICARCSVSKECLEFALKNDEHAGIWGGFSARERYRMKRGAA
jgi:WhiB family redox-sensing transcriptional regulator